MALEVKCKQRKENKTLFGITTLQQSNVSKERLYTLLLYIIQQRLLLLLIIISCTHPYAPIAQLSLCYVMPEIVGHQGERGFRDSWSCDNTVTIHSDIPQPFVRLFSLQGNCYSRIRILLSVVISQVNNNNHLMFNILQDSLLSIILWADFISILLA